MATEGRSKIAYLLERLAQGVAAHDRENPGHHSWGIGMSHFDIERLGLEEGEQILPGDATAPSGAGGLLLVGMTASPEVETDFNAWYDTEHVPALARVPGVLCARRFRTNNGNPKYIALYHLIAPGVVDSPEWKQASGSTPMPQRVRDQITNRLRLVCRSYARVDR